MTTLAPVFTELRYEAHWTGPLRTKTIIAGSREIDDYAIVAHAVKRSGYHITEVVSGGARGVDALGERWARTHSVPIWRRVAKWKKHGRAAGFIRNAEMVEYADALIAIWDGGSKGTAHTIRLAKKAGLAVFVFIWRGEVMVEGLPTIEEQEGMVTAATAFVKNTVNKYFPKEVGEYKPFRMMVKKLLPSMADTPAAGRVEYHSAWAGGLLVHTAEVIKLALKLAEDLGPDIGDVEDRDAVLRSVVKCAFLHDLGKIGNGEFPYYHIQENEWRKENLGETFTINRKPSELPYMPVPVRAVWLAQQHGVSLSEIEVQAIIASDGEHTPHGKAVIASLLQHPITMLIHFADLWVSQARGI